jgi:sensor histidine kinase YesM
MDAFRLNKSDYKIIGGYLLVATIWLVINFYVEAYTLVEYFIDIPVFWLQTILMLYVSKVLINAFLVKSKNYFALIIFALFSFWFFGFLASISGEITRSGMINWNELPPFIELIFININSSAANLAIPLTVISAKKYYEYQLQSAELSSTQKELELKVLKSQFNPHFLYNSLNTIDALVDYSPKEKVKEYISNLSGLYRYLIAVKDEDITTVEAEIALAKNYCYLIETRFEDDYQFIMPNNYPYKDKYLPNGALLTALENVVKHNKPLSNKPIIATIFINENEIKISNIISKNKTNESLGTGLLNLEKRYELLSDKEVEIMQTEQEFCITLPLLTVVD